MQHTETSLRAVARVPSAPKGCGGVIAIGVVARSAFMRGLLTKELGFVNCETGKRLDKFFSFDYRSAVIEFSVMICRLLPSR